jgi:hypothetical protein
MLRASTAGAAMSGPATYPITPPRDKSVHRRAPLKPPQAPYRSLALQREQRQEENRCTNDRSKENGFHRGTPSSTRRDTSPSFHPAATDNSEANNWFPQSSCNCLVAGHESLKFPIGEIALVAEIRTDDAVTCRCNDLRPDTCSRSARSSRRALSTDVRYRHRAC